MSEADAPRQDERPSQGGTPDDPVVMLEARLETSLGDRATALASLTHKSYVNEHRDEVGLTDNERLEFLGDAVIDLAVSHRLMERFPGAREGDLSKMRAAVVDEQGLSEMARALDLGSLLRLGRGEELTGGRAKASLLADAMEAVVAAVYLGGGLEPVLALIDRFLGEAFARASAGTLDRDYKTQFQELAQSRLRATPRYRVIGEHGPDHSKTFEVETDLRGEVLGRGAGRSKKDAEQAAAKLALDLLGRRYAPAENGGEAPPRGGGIAAAGASAEARNGGEGTPVAPAPSAGSAPPGGTAAYPIASAESPPQRFAPAAGPSRQPDRGAASGGPPSEPAPARRTGGKARAKPARAKPGAKKPGAKKPARRPPAPKRARKGTRRER